MTSQLEQRIKQTYAAPLAMLARLKAAYEDSASPWPDYCSTRENVEADAEMLLRKLGE